MHTPPGLLPVIAGKLQCKGRAIKNHFSSQGLCFILSQMLKCIVNYMLECRTCGSETLEWNIKGSEGSEKKQSKSKGATRSTFGNGCT